MGTAANLHDRSLAMCVPASMRHDGPDDAATAVPATAKYPRVHEKGRKGPDDENLP